MLTINNLTFRYPYRSKPAVNNVSLEILPGGIYGLLGENGVGKSTLLYLISGLLTPNEGNSMLFGVDTRKREPQTLSDIILVPEEFNLPNISLSEYVKVNAPFYPNFSQEILELCLDEFHLERNLHLGRLSMGQKKKVFIAFAIAANTKLLLMDEPTNGFDIPGKAAFRAIMARTMSEERAVVISTHQVQDINLLLDHVIIMANDGIVLNASVGQILQKLAFKVTINQEEIEQALFAQPSLAGAVIVKENTDGIETDINLESLFQLAVFNRPIVERIFKNK